MGAALNVSARASSDPLQDCKLTKRYTEIQEQIHRLKRIERVLTAISAEMIIRPCIDKYVYELRTNCKFCSAKEGVGVLGLASVEPNC